jgi:hypothetical protein
MLLAVNENAFKQLDTRRRSSKAEAYIDIR